MKHPKRYRRFWHNVYPFASRLLHHKFDMSAETLNLPGPALIICNHVSNWDPLFVGFCFPQDQLSFVASEHLLRQGLVTKVLQSIVSIIARPKASGSTQTVITCMKELKAGNSVCLFAEGDATWNGVTQEVFPATGKMARATGAYLVTMRSERLYLADPRWAHNLRKAPFSIGPVHVYSPEELKAMEPSEITDAINHDIFYDIWEEQRREPVKISTKKRADRLESALFMCPGCHGISTLKGEDDRISCSCGFETRLNEYGFFEPAEPFATIAEWDTFQHEALKKGDFKHAGDSCFSDKSGKLIEIQNGHRSLSRQRGVLTCYEDRISVGNKEFLFSDISDMSMVKTNRLLFSVGHEYYEIKVPKSTNVRKYLAVWRERHGNPM